MTENLEEVSLESLPLHYPLLLPINTEIRTRGGISRGTKSAFHGLTSVLTAFTAPIATRTADEARLVMEAMSSYPSHTLVCVTTILAGTSRALCTMAMLRSTAKA